jgi:hypothetical protein
MRTRALAAAAACLALAGCSGEDWQVLDADGVSIVLQPDSDGGDGALLTGVLTVVDGCLGVTDDFGDTHVVHWPASTRLESEDPLRIAFEHGGPVGIGDPVGLGGGGRPDGRVAGAPVPEECADAPTFSAWTATVARS